MIGLIFCGDLKYCPYINRYIERLEKNNSEYCVYFWNRGGFNLDLPENYIAYNSTSNLNKSKIGKVIDFLKFRKWILKRIKIDNPKKIIVLSTLTGVVLGKYLYKSSRKYVFDIRDYSYEHIKPFYKIEKKVIANSYFTAISSKGFQEFLPKFDYVIAHNFNRNDLIKGKKINKFNNKINFVWNGVIRYFEFQKDYLNALKNDERYEIIFHGDGPELILYKNYCEANGFTNVIFTGSYDNSEKGELLKNAGVLNNCYGYPHNAGNKLKYAVSNRFYDGIIYHIPQLVEPYGYKTNWTKKVGIGVSFIPSSNFADELFNYYKSIDSEAFDNACDNALREVIAEDDEYIKKIDCFINM